MLRAKDIMTRDVITVTPATTIEELARLLAEHRISGAPVVNGAGELIGIVTEHDLVSRDKRLHIPTIIRLFDAYIMLESPGAMEKEIKKMAAVTVEDIYVKDVITITENNTVEDIATIMTEKKKHLLPVVEGFKVRGIVGRIDLIKGMGRK
jgi:CBS domain-containing protein